MLNLESIDNNPYRTVIHAGIIGLLSVVIYLNSLQNGFSVDDFNMVVNNPAVHGFSAKNLYSLFTSVPNRLEFLPVKDLTYCADTAIAGISPAAMHLSNIAWYILASISFYFFLSRLVAWWDIKGDNLAFISAILFVAHPMHVASVASICQRKDLVSGFLLFISLNLYLSFRMRGRNHLYILSIIAYILTIFSKATVMTIPLFILSVEWFSPSGKRVSAVRSLLLSVPFFLISAVFIMIESRFLHQTGVLSQLFSSTVSMPTRLATAVMAVFYYFKLMIVPYPMLLIHDFGFVKNVFAPLPIIAGFGVVVLVAVSAALRQRAPIIGTGLLLILVTLIPVSGLIPSNTLIAERYLFLPLAGFAMIIGASVQWMLQKGGRSRLVGIMVLMLLVTGYSILTIKRNPDWRDNLTLLLANARDLPGKPGIYYQVGSEYFALGKEEAAFEYLAKAKQLNPFYEIHYAVFLAISSYQKGDIAKAKAILDGTQHKFKYYVAEVNYLYGKIRQSTGDIENAALFYRNAANSAMPLGIVKRQDIVNAQASLGKGR